LTTSAARAYCEVDVSRPSQSCLVGLAPRAGREPAPGL